MRPKRTGLRVVAAAIAFAIVPAACGGDDDDNDANAAPSTTPSTTPTMEDSTTSSPTSSGQDSNGGAATISSAETSLGPTLVDANGKTIYLFENDTAPNESTCTGDCAATWPPVTVDGALVLGEGLDDGAFTTFAREDGAMQVSVEGHPLYTFGPDTNAGDTNGQGVGGVWFAVGPDGRKIDSDQATSSGFGYSR